MRREPAPRLAVKAFAHTARYDAAIATTCAAHRRVARAVARSAARELAARAAAALRREPAPAGGALRRRRSARRGTVAARAAAGQGAVVQQPRRRRRGARSACSEFDGAGVRDREAREPVRRRARRRHRARPTTRAYRTDPESAFGGIIAFNRPLDAAAAEAIVEQQFIEVVIAPEFGTRRARGARRRRRTCACSRRAGRRAADGRELDLQAIVGGLLRAERATRAASRSRRAKVVTRRAPTDAELRDLGSPGGREAREVERDRVRAATARRSASAPARCAASMSARSRRSRPREAGLDVAGRGAGVRRVLPVPRRRRRGRRARRHARSCSPAARCATTK